MNLVEVRSFILKSRNRIFMCYFGNCLWSHHVCSQLGHTHSEHCCHTRVLLALNITFYRCHFAVIILVCTNKFCPKLLFFIPFFMVKGAVICFESRPRTMWPLCILHLLPPPPPPPPTLPSPNLTNTSLIFSHLSLTTLTFTDATQSHISMPYVHCTLHRSFEGCVRSPCNIS